MRIPEIREELLRIADNLQNIAHLPRTADLIRDLVKEMHRRPYVRKAGPRRKTPEPKYIRAYAQTYPDADYMQIANACGVNTGRVSEALAGFRA